MILSDKRQNRYLSSMNFNLEILLGIFSKTLMVLKYKKSTI